MVLLLCRACLSNGALKDMEWDLKQWNPLIQDKALVPWLLQPPEEHEALRARPISSAQIAALEDLWREDPSAQLQDLSQGGVTDIADPVRQDYEDGFHYQNILAPLVKAEADEDRRTAERVVRDSVSVSWELATGSAPLARFNWASSGGQEERVLPGHEVKLHLPPLRSGVTQGLAWEGVGIVRDSRDMVISVELHTGLLLDDSGNEISRPSSKQALVVCPTDISEGFSVQLVWKSVSFDRMQAALRTFALDDKAVSPTLYQALLGHAVEPGTVAGPSHRSLSTPGLPQLNPSQLLALRTTLSRPLSLIQGPPGTGKTVTSAAIVYHLKRQSKGQILVSAPSNVAVDQLTAKIAATGLKVIRLYARSKEATESDVQSHALHNIVADVATLPPDMAAQWEAEMATAQAEGAPSRETTPRTATATKPKMPGAPAAVQLLGGMAGTSLTRLHWLRGQYGDLTVANELKYRKLVARAEAALLKAADVICCTCVGAGDKRLRGMKFRQVLIDEVTQASEPEVIIPVVKGAKQLVLVGDHCQLGPVVLSKVAAAAGLHQSLFERLIMRGVRPLRLAVQYRMHPVLAEFPSNIFYDGSLQNGVTLAERTPTDTALEWPMPGRPMFFYISTGAEEIAGSGTSYINRSEASSVERVVTNFLRSGVQPSQIGVITPYEGQRGYIINHMTRHGSMPGGLYSQVEVASVDSFQGREKDYTILSCVRSNEHQGIGFLNDPRRLNVALTRARYGMVVVGNPKVLAKQSLWNNLLHHFKQMNCLVEGPLTALRHSKMHFPRPRRYINPRYKLYTVGLAANPNTFGEVSFPPPGTPSETTQAGAGSGSGGLSLADLGAGSFPFSADGTMAGYTSAVPLYGIGGAVDGVWASGAAGIPAEYGAALSDASAAAPQKPEQ